MSLQHVCVAMLTAAFLSSTGRAAGAQSIESALAKLTSGVDSVRLKSLDQLARLSATKHFVMCGPTASDEIKKALIAALENENTLIQTGERDEAEGEFHGNLIGCVAGIRDEKSVRGLVGAIDTGWGAISGILNLGDAAVPEVETALRTSTNRTTVRAISAMTLGSFLAPTASMPVSANSRMSIRRALLDAASDRHPLVRAGAIRSLATFSDAEVRRVVRADASFDTGMKIGSEPRKYPVGNAARNWIKQDSMRSRKLIP